MLYNHWSEVPLGVWPCKYFKPQEIACKGTGSILIDEVALQALDRFRVGCNLPIHISSGYRSPHHNAVVGGAPLSSHLAGHAFDVQLRGCDRHFLHDKAKGQGFTGFGMNYQTFIHIDMGRRREW